MTAVMGRLTSITCANRVNTVHALQVIVEFADVTAAMGGRQSMHGRRFAGRTVVATHISEAAYAAGQF